jgi:type III pantothenate kinase
MDLCLDLGNSQLSLGVFVDGVMQFETAAPKQVLADRDLLGDFFKQSFEKGQTCTSKVKRIAIASVVPEYDACMQTVCEKLFDLSPQFLRASDYEECLQYEPAASLGADRLANFLAVKKLYPEKDCVVVDLGTATTVCAIGAAGKFLGGLIAPGMRLQTEVLQVNAAKLPSVAVVRADHAIGNSTISGIQAGIYFSQLGLIKEAIARFKQEAFSGKEVTVIGCGGYVSLFEDEALFDAIERDLVLKGLAFSLTR